MSEALAKIFFIEKSIKKEIYFSLVHFRRDALFSYDFRDIIRVQES